LRQRQRSVCRLPVTAAARAVGDAAPAARGVLHLLGGALQIRVRQGLDLMLKQRQIIRWMAGQARLPQQFGGLGEGSACAVNCCASAGWPRSSLASINAGKLREEGAQVLHDALKGNAGRLHAKQQAGLPIDLSDTAEHRVADLQLYPQALVERPLEQVRQQAPCGFICQGARRRRAEQQQGRIEGIGVDLMP